ncbi:MAG: hypothetical protein KJO76_04975 [Gammaproteobacteria bacterium]|nr:hypothetical protein [Gammaproteobacteria bacterium]
MSAAAFVEFGDLYTSYARRFQSLDGHVQVPPDDREIRHLVDLFARELFLDDHDLFHGSLSGFRVDQFHECVGDLLAEVAVPRLESAAGG